MLPNFSLCGRMGSGKSTFAQHLVSNYGYTKVSFADALKRLATEACGMREKDRELLQRLGVGVRDIDPDFWVNAAFKTIRTIQGPIVIDDLRFPNELKACQQHGFLIFRVVRDRNTRISSFGLDPDKIYDFEGHISETALDSENLKPIDSDMSMDEYKENIDRIMQEFLPVLENK